MKTKLTPTQQKALAKMHVGYLYSAYDLQVSLGTLDALVRKGYLTSKYPVGYLFLPRLSIEYRLVISKNKGVGDGDRF